MFENNRHFSLDEPIRGMDADPMMREPMRGGMDDGMSRDRDGSVRMRPDRPFPPAIVPVPPVGCVPPNLPEGMEPPVSAPGYLAQRIGRIVRVELQVGEGLVERTGRLLAVGPNTLLLETAEGQVLVDMATVKFVTIIFEPIMPLN